MYEENEPIECVNFKTIQKNIYTIFHAKRPQREKQIATVPKDNANRAALLGLIGCVLDYVIPRTVDSIKYPSNIYHDDDLMNVIASKIWEYLFVNKQMAMVEDGDFNISNRFPLLCEESDHGEEFDEEYLMFIPLKEGKIY